MKEFWFIFMCVCACVCVCVCVSFSCVLVPLWTVTCQAPLSKGFPRQEFWNGLPFSSPGDLPNPEIIPRSPTLQADSLLSESPRESFTYIFFPQGNKIQNDGQIE